MNKVIVCACLFLAALTGTANAQGPVSPVPNPNLTSMVPEEACIVACRHLINDASCHPRADIYNCVAQQQACTGNPQRIASAIAALYLEDNDCPAAPPPTVITTRRTTTTGVRRTTRPTTTVVAPPAPAPAMDPTQLTYVLPALPILGEGPVDPDAQSRLAQRTCEALGGEWYAEGRTADPSRERIVALIENLVTPNIGPGGGPDDDRTPGVCLTPEGVVFVGVIREVISQMRTAHGEQALQIEDLRNQVEALRALRQELEDLRAQPTADTSAYEARIRELEERMRQQEARYADALQELYRAIQLYRDVRERSAGSQPATESSARPRERQRVQVPRLDPNRHRLTGERLGFIVETAGSMSRFQLVAHEGSRSPKFFGLGLGLTIRLRDHLYLAGVIDIGAGLKDGEEVAPQFEAHYRVGLLGVAVEHLLLGGGFASHHRYSGSGALREQDGPWYQYRFRGAELEVGYLLRERGVSPFISLQLGLGQGQHADRRLDNDEPDGRYDRFETYVGFRFGVMRLRRR